MEAAEARETEMGVGAREVRRAAPLPCRRPQTMELMQQRAVGLRAQLGQTRNSNRKQLIVGKLTVNCQR